MCEILEEEYVALSKKDNFITYTLFYESMYSLADLFCQSQLALEYA